MVETINSLSPNVTIPRTFQEALQSPERSYWIEALTEEIASLNAHMVYRLVKAEHARGRKLITTRWIFDLKKNAIGAIIRFKARLVARGFDQTKGIDYEETFSPVVSFTAIRLMLSIACQRGMVVHQIDIKTAFLNGELDIAHT